MKYYEHGNIFNYMKRLWNPFNECQARWIIAQVVLALQYLHEEMKVIHRDLKPENLLIDVDGYVVLTDFGISDLCQGEQPNRLHGPLFGTLNYTPPELLMKKNYDFAVDFW